MPVEFPQTIWLDVHVGSGRPRLLEVPGRILDLNPTTRGDLFLLLGQAEHVRIWNIAVGRLFGLLVSMTLLRRRNGAPENVGILGGKLLEVGDAETEILRDNFDRGMNEPVGKHESCPSSIEIAIGKDQKELEPVIQCLDTMGEVLGETRGELGYGYENSRCVAAHVNMSGSEPFCGPLISLIYVLP